MLFCAAGDPGGDWRVSDGRGDLSLAVRRERVHAYSGLRVVFPSNALDAAGLLRTAIRCDDPVLFLEHKRLYRETFGRAPYPGPDYMIPFGRRRWCRRDRPDGDHVWAVVPRALQAAQKLEREHRVSVELIDLRCLNPFDWDAIAASVKKTNRR